MSALDFRILGPIQVNDNGRALSLGGSKRRAVLAILLLHANEVVTVDRLVDDLWADRPPQNAAAAIQSHVSRLRKLLGADVILTRHGGYTLEVDTTAIDLHRFEQLAAEAELADPVTRAALLRDALELWRGPALADLTLEPFASSESARLEEARLATLESRIEADLALGRHREVVGELRQLVATNPLREGLRGQLIIALYRAGRQAEALAVYREARRILSEELGLEPGPALKELERGILHQDPELAAPIYLSGASPWPVATEDWEARAEEMLEPGPYGYVAGGAGGEATIRANAAAFERVRLRPRMLTGGTTRDLSVEVLGTRSPYPFFLAPIGLQRIAHPDAELASARAAATLGVPYCVSTITSYSMEEIAEAMGDAPRWFQLYWLNDREVTASLVDRAAAAGYSAIVVTVDTPIVGWRPRDIGREYVPYSGAQGVGQLTSDPVFRSRLPGPPEENPLAAAEAMIAMFPNLALTWGDLRWLRERTPLPLLVKGILRVDDANRALEAGADGIVVSNHGGRQVDGAVASLDALVEVRRELGPDAIVLMDSGIRRGADVLKALAAGANAVFVGRPYVYGLAVGGEQGVETVLRQLAAETDVTLALVGGSAVRDLDGSWIVGLPQ
jgi:isopentenyl diphosphate isomerase/L-lactate dehydrogenase-like FMN-dependent dehydrogenase/DNA-binding SARP family transcriptional activator